ncbi:MAG TPA: hypothetical protein GX010_04315 [Erysipelotrichaceae bacterium]|nr:hypothetical protein [Erysipelotrichaceae bacterium]
MSKDKTPKDDLADDSVEKETPTLEDGEQANNSIDSKEEPFYFPWSTLIICGILIVLMIICFVVIMVLEN